MNPVAFDTDAFMRGRVTATFHHEGSCAYNDHGSWWLLGQPALRPGATWYLCRRDARKSGPAVVDDFGDLVLVGWRL